ncbi:MAG: thioredoxin family protein [Vicinamibacterales bacterium]
MSLLAPADQQRLTADFAALTRRVHLLFFTQTVGCDTCLQAREIIDEFPPLTDKVDIEEVNLILDRERAERYGIDRAPAIAIEVEDESGRRDTHIRFLGLPSGYEFIALVRAVMLAGGAEPTLSDDSRERLKAIDSPLTVRVFSTPTCPHCPRAIMLAHEIAWANPNVTAYGIETTEYPDLAREYRVTGVPKTVVKDVEILGAIPEEEFVDQVLAGYSSGSAGEA